MQHYTVTLTVPAEADDPITPEEAVRRFRSDVSQNDYVYIVTDDESGESFTVDTAEAPVPD